jgi:hypothetical protein
MTDERRQNKKLMAGNEENEHGIKKAVEKTKRERDGWKKERRSRKRRKRNRRDVNDLRSIDSSLPVQPCRRMRVEWRKYWVAPAQA